MFKDNHLMFKDNHKNKLFCKIYLYQLNSRKNFIATYKTIYKLAID